MCWPTFVLNWKTLFFLGCDCGRSYGLGRLLGLDGFTLGIFAVGLCWTWLRVSLSRTLAGWWISNFFLFLSYHHNLYSTNCILLQYFQPNNNISSRVVIPSANQMFEEGRIYTCSAPALFQPRWH
jgi:hypothetical protein